MMPVPWNLPCARRVSSERFHREFRKTYPTTEYVNCASHARRQQIFSSGKAGAEATHVCVQSQSGCHTDWEVREQTHQERCQRSNGSSGRDQITTHLCYALEVGIVCDTAVSCGADAGASAVGENRCIDGDLERDMMIICFDGPRVFALTMYAMAA